MLKVILLSWIPLGWSEKKSLKSFERKFVTSLAPPHGEIRATPVVLLARKLYKLKQNPLSFNHSTATRYKYNSQNELTSFSTNKYGFRSAIPRPTIQLTYHSSYVNYCDVYIHLQSKMYVIIKMISGPLYIAPLSFEFSNLNGNLLKDFYFHGFEAV